MYNLEKNVNKFLENKFNEHTKDYERKSIVNQICNLIKNQKDIEDWRKSLNFEAVTKNKKRKNLFKST